jgi:hypothetical protein
MAEINANVWDRAANTWRRLVDTATIAWNTSVKGQVTADVLTPSSEFSGLPDAGENTGARRLVTDATATTFASVVAGGGSNIVPVYSDGTDWRIG